MIRRCWISLYDRRCRFLDIHPPPDSPWTDGQVIGTHVWKTIAPEHQEAFKAVFAHVVRKRVSAIWDGLDLHGVWWRAWLFPMRHTANHAVAVAAIVRKWPEAVAALSPIDRGICAGIAAGMLNKQIAIKQDIGESTVKTHRRKIAARLKLPVAALPGWCGLHQEWLS
jgi:DNA-binding CsgD family transcriptional regulator